MLQHLFPAALIALVVPAAAAMDIDGGGQAARLTIHERLIVRVPRLARHPDPTPVQWKEHHGPKCIDATDLAGAIVSAPLTVDLVLTGNRRVRARLDGDCMPLDFYGGFYVQAGSDGMVCADRDVIRSRSGAACEIDAFRRLKLGR